MQKMPDAQQVIALLEQQNRRGLAKAVTCVENGGPEKEILLEYAYKKPPGSTLTVGITGAGGAGKSTLIDKLMAEYRRQGKTVGVIAVDPTSPYSGGAFLGDRVRMSSHNSDAGVFIRSFGSRNSLGGISEAAKQALYLYKAYGFDVIIVESIGVGQDETEISRYVDVNTVVIVPGLGDTMQMSKAGVRETADVFIVNKSDKPEADVLKEHLLNSFGMLPHDKWPPVVSTIASDGVGIQEAVEAIYQAFEKQKPQAAEKLRERIRAEIASSVNYILQQKFQGLIMEATEQVCRGELMPFEASRKLAAAIEYRED